MNIKYIKFSFFNILFIYLIFDNKNLIKNTINKKENFHEPI
jgi:hypothetical protein